MHKKFKNKIFISFIFIVFFSGYTALAVHLSSASAQGQSDAIAIRVIPNPKHYSVERWYRDNEFTGSPQQLTVDGYDAIRDGRTVYVGAANVDLLNDELYTNIYLISYNQKAENNTINIFSRIIQSWKLNSNLTVYGACSITNTVFCLIDDECPSGEYCQSEKAKVIRDTKRLADLTDLGSALENYKATEGRYPAISAGTYLPYKTLSVWPSWRKSLGQVLRYSIPLDPINKLGDCGGAGYDPITCWNEDSKSFPTNLNTPAFPAGSRIYFYSSNSGGTVADYCALLETTYPNIGSFNCLSGVALNNPPRFTGAGLLPGLIGQDYYGYLEAVDPDGDTLTWTASGPPPTLSTAGIANQRTVFVPNLSGNVAFTATIDDGRGGVVSQVFTIITTASAGIDTPTITGTISDYDIIIGSDITFSISGSEPNSEYSLRFEFRGAPSGFNSTGSVDPAGTTLNVSGDVIDHTENYSTTLTIFDSSGHASTPIGFRINVRNNPPTINTASLPDATGCLPYSFVVAASDPDGHNITFSMEGPEGLNINSVTGEISGRPTVGAGTYPVRVMVKDEYFDFSDTAEDSVNFTINISDEVYSLTMPNTYDFYAAPETINPEDLYHSPTSYYGVAEKSTLNPVIWSMVTAPDPLIDGLYFVINPDNGEITSQTTNNNIPAVGYNLFGQVSATTFDCDIPVTEALNLTVYPNEWCGDGTVQANEQCESPGTGSSQTDQYDCISCSWSGGWCGNGICELDYESSSTSSVSSCIQDCGSPNSLFSVCTDVITQPACYSGTYPSPRLTWAFSAPSNESCDCDGVPINDCPTGTPCLPSSQVSYEIMIDDDPGYISPNYTVGPINSSNHFHTVTSQGLNYGTWYYWQLRVRDNYGTITPWVQCTGPFLVNDPC